MARGMITFACRCSNRITVDDDQAGESMQCPRCGLLVDVPTIDDLPGLREDGSYEFNDEKRSEAQSRSHPMLDTPSPMRKEPTDRRLSLKEFLNVGTSDDDLLEIKDEVRPGVPKHPKYDPETGELILPLDVRKETKPAPVMALQATLGYERKKVDDAVPSILAPFVWMFRLPNMIVCMIATFICVAASVMFAVGTVIWLLLLFVLPLMAMLIAHFANTVDETGPTGTDEMPPPLRSANLFDDFIKPVAQVFGAYLLAMSPIFLVNLYVTKLSLPVEIGLSIFLHITLPAILLTMITSGAFNNLLPNRIFSVITASGGHYWAVTAIGYVAVLSVGIAQIVCLKAGFTITRLLFAGPLSSTTPMFGLPRGIELLLAPIVTFIAMYLMHVYAWQLGLLYRLHHDKFDWVWQKHDKSDRNDTQAQLHKHRQRQLEQQAAKARANMEACGADGSQNIPVAKPIEPRQR